MGDAKVGQQWRRRRCGWWTAFAPNAPDEPRECACGEPMPPDAKPYHGGPLPFRPGKNPPVAELALLTEEEHATADRLLALALGAG